MSDNNASHDDEYESTNVNAKHGKLNLGGAAKKFGGFMSALASVATGSALDKNAPTNNNNNNNPTTSQTLTPGTSTEKVSAPVIVPERTRSQSSTPPVDNKSPQRGNTGANPLRLSTEMSPPVQATDVSDQFLPERTQVRKPRKPQEWKFDILDLDDVLQDSPMFKEKIKIVEEDIDDIAIKLKRLTKLTRDIKKASEAVSKLQVQFGEELRSFSQYVYDEELERSLDQFGYKIVEMENVREVLHGNMENLIAVPSEKFFKQELEEVREMKQKLSKSRTQYDAALAKSSQLKKKIDSMKVLEVEHELSDAKQEFQTNNLQYVYALNDFQSIKKLDVFERICSSMYSLSAFYHQGYEHFHEMDSLMHNLTSHMQNVRREFEEQQSKNTARMEEVAKEYTNGSSSSYSKPVNSTAKTHQGYLFKRNNGVRKDWQRRYFVIENGFIKYYKHSKDTQPTTAINLLLCSVKAKDDIDRRFCFEVISPDKTYILQAENDEQMHDWISVLQNATADALNSQHLVKKSAFTATPDTERHEKTPKPFDIIRDASPLNKVCADCGTPDPDWASINLGILVCINCSGIHRNLGVHVSKVRSFTLDKWEPDMLKMMVAIGNERANAIFEAYIPSDVQKPDPQSDRNYREKYIKQKYVEHRFVKREEDPQVKDLAEENELLYSLAKSGDVVDVLKSLASGADVNYSNEEDGGKTPLHIATIDSNVLVVLLLTQNRANVNAQDQQQKTPMHYAALHGRISCATVLFKNGAKLDIKDSDGQTPLDIAVTHQKADCVTFLRLASLAVAEGTIDDSFMEALQSFSQEAASKADEEQQQNQ